MADEDTTTVVEDETSSQLDFTDEELAALDGDSEDGTTPEAEEDPEGEEGEEGEDSEEEEGEGEDEGDPEGGEGEEGAEEGEEGAEDEDKEKEPEVETFELEVKGQKHTVEGIDDLAALAQKGIFFEAECNQMRSQVESASFTMNAMVKDPMGFFEAYLTQKNGGNYDQARADCYRVADAYMKPILEEIGADENGRAKLRQARDDKIAAQREREEYQNKTFTHEDMEWIRVAQHNVGIALAEAGLPEDSSRMRKRMADIMLEQHRGGNDVHPQQAAKLLREELESLGHEIASPPKGGKKVRTKEERQAAIKRARAKKSRKKTAGAREGTPRGEVRTINSRQFLDGIDNALNLSRY